MAHVGDVERSIAFYSLLGFENLRTLGQNGHLQWAWMQAGEARLMLVRSSRPMNPAAQDVLFYLYATDVVVYREELAARGVKVSPLSHPAHMPAGEFRIDDPDCYCLLVGQYEGLIAGEG